MSMFISQWNVCDITKCFSGDFLKVEPVQKSKKGLNF